MNAHLSNQIVERFHRETLTQDDRGQIYPHILGCEACRKLVVTPEAETAAVAALTNHLLPQADEEPFHLDTATVEAFVEDKLDALDRTTAKLHLDDCVECSDEVADFRESLATMRAAARKDAGTVVVERRRPSRFTMPARIAATIAIVAFAAIALLAIWRWRLFVPPKAPGVDTTAGSQPSPIASPAAPGVAPSPSNLNPPNLAVIPHDKPGAESASKAPLKDGPNEISIDQAGNVAGMPSLPTDSQRAVKSALSGESLVRPSVLDEVATAEVSTRGGNEDRIRIVSPLATVVAQEKPTLHWIPLKTAEGYRIEIADENFRQVAKSDNLPSFDQTWISTALKRGQVYTWTIRAINKDGQLSDVASQGKFKVLSDDRLRELNQLKAHQSHLALGVFYAQEGMIAEAEREFGILVKDNPDSAVAKKLLNEVRAWRER